MEENKVYELNQLQRDIFRQFEKAMEKNTENVINQIVDFIKLQHQNANRPKVIIGLSGGIDSSLTTVLLTKALGEENVIGIKMPYKGISSDESIKYADIIIDFLQLPEKNVFEIPINEAVDATLRGIEKAGVKFEPLDVGNVMARERMINLYALARIYQGMVVDTCNKTEILLGYFTRYGDGASDYNPMGGIYKTQVWQISRYLGIPEEIVKRKPSAELSLNQNDEDDLGISYQAVDLMLWLMKEKKVKEEKLIGKYFYPKEIVWQVTSRVKGNRFKSELPPLLKLHYE